MSDALELCPWCGEMPRRVASARPQTVCVCMDGEERSLSIIAGTRESADANWNAVARAIRGACATPDTIDWRARAKALEAVAGAAMNLVAAIDVHGTFALSSLDMLRIRSALDAARSSGAIGGAE